VEGAEQLSKLFGGNPTAVDLAQRASTTGFVVDYNMGDVQGAAHKDECILGSVVFVLEQQKGVTADFKIIKDDNIICY